jgi:signal transduction histidine kinase
MNQSLRRIHHLGSATAELFSRLYAGLTRRSAQPAPEQVLATAESAKLRRNNRRLKRMLQDREQTIEQFETILGQIQEGVILQDLQGAVVYTNAAADMLLGSQKNFWQSQLAAWFHDFATLNTLANELTLLDTTRKLEIGERVVGARVALVADSRGQRIGTLILLRDMTRDTLAERIKDSIITSISHELKTPMNVMRIASEILLSQPEDAPPNRKMLDKLSKNIDVLDRMIIELLDVSEMSAGTFAVRREPVLVDTLLWDVVDSFEQDITRAKLDVLLMLRDTAQLVLAGDAARLKWALGHLLRNAIAYNEPQGHIRLSAKLADGGQALELQLHDTGVGIAEKDLPRIFDLFYRGEARTAQGRLLDPRGLGQGLFIARRVIEAHGGTLQLATKLHGGTQVTLHLPISAPPTLPTTT